MTGRGTHAAEPGQTLPVFDRLAPPPAPAALAAQIDLHTRPGDVVVDLAGRGGWVARAAVDRHRRALSLESDPLTRMLAEVVLRPPDVRHLDVAFQSLALAPRGNITLKAWLTDMYATRCATCGRALVADELTWSLSAYDDGGGDADARTRDSPHPVMRHYRCDVCRAQLGGSELRQAPPEAEDLQRATAEMGAATARAALRQRFPDVPRGIAGGTRLIDDMVDLHTPRQLVALSAIQERIESELRAAPVLAALRLALLHAILPSSRLYTGPGRVPWIRIAGGRVRLPGETTFRERNPWLSFEEAYRTVRGFVQRLGGGVGPVEARLGEDLHALGEGHATAVLGLAAAPGLLAIRDGAYSAGRTGATPRIRLVIGQPPMRPSLDRLATAYHATAWVLGREAAALLAVDGLARTARGPSSPSGSSASSWGWQAAAIGRELESVAPAMARDSRAVELTEPGPEALVAAALGGASAGFRLLSVRTGDADETPRSAPAIVELVPPGGVMPPGPRTRANVALEAVPGGAGDPSVVPGRGLFQPPERVADRPFSATEAARTVTATAVEALRARGEPASFDRLLGEILVGLDRAGHLRRLVDASDVSDLSAAPPAAAPTAVPTAVPTPVGGLEADPTPDDVVERLLTIVRDELGRPTQRSVSEIVPGTWWLSDPRDVADAALPLADRLEWAVFSLLSAAGPIAESAFLERMATLFTGHDLPDSGLVRAALESYRSPASTPDAITTDDDLLRRSGEHTELVGLIAEAGRRLGMRLWIARREQGRPYRRGVLGDLLGATEDRPYLGRFGRAAEELLEVDAIWSVRGRLAFLFEVEWTAMLGEPLLRRHAHIPPDDDLIRFLVIAPERTELVRYKLAHSRLLSAAMDEGNWHVIKSNHLRRFLARDPLELGDLEPYLGLDPAVERGGEQMPLFGA